MPRACKLSHMGVHAILKAEVCACLQWVRQVIVPAENPGRASQPVRSLHTAALIVERSAPLVGFQHLVSPPSLCPQVAKARGVSVENLRALAAMFPNSGKCVQRRGSIKLRDGLTISFKRGAVAASHSFNNPPKVSIRGARNLWGPKSAVLYFARSFMRFT